MNTNTLEQLIQNWKTDPTVKEHVVFSKTIPPTPAKLSSFPHDLNERLARALQADQIHQLYSHQLSAWDKIQKGVNTAITTGTASGKSLCYYLPILNSFFQHTGTCSLFLFPTKALAQDQEKTLRNLLIKSGENKELEKWIGIYDGDTPGEKRKSVKKDARFVFTNPDMLHQGILPYHTSWSRFFRNLQYIVIDEMHTYRGVFGSHVANVIRRLKRIARFHGSNPQFILTSATIANPVAFAERMIEAPVQMVSEDGSPHGKRNILFYNPPIIQKELSLRCHPAKEATRLTGDLLARGIQTLIFTQSRKSVEITLKNLHSIFPDQADSIFPYRSGYLPKERRYIEKSIRDGTARVVVSTNALELGIDIGGLDSILMIGYPGTISGFRQEAGRAGRTDNRSSLAMLIASPNPLDQFILKHPDYLFENSVEQALINPDNLIILLQHLRCAIYELPFDAEEHFGTVDKKTLDGLLNILKLAENIHFSSSKFFWISGQYPAAEVSLRTAGDRKFLLQQEINGRAIKIGEIDEPSAYWMVHPDAIYLHAGQIYKVDKMNLQEGIVDLSPADGDYYTEPKQKTSVTKIMVHKQEEISVGCKVFGEIQVKSQVTGYKKILWETNEIISLHDLDMPETQLTTAGTWITINDQTITTLKEKNRWSDERNYYGANWQKQRQQALERDRYTCQACGKTGTSQTLHVHHKTPFKSFSSFLEANQLHNLVTLCAPCHIKAETVVRIRSGLGGLGYVFHHLAPLLLMCDFSDIGVVTDPNASFAEGNPGVLIYDQIPAGIGLSENLFRTFNALSKNALELVESCSCIDGCPSCVGAPGEMATGAKPYTLELLRCINERVAP